MINNRLFYLLGFLFIFCGLYNECVAARSSDSKLKRTRAARSRVLSQKRKGRARAYNKARNKRALKKVMRTRLVARPMMTRLQDIRLCLIYGNG